MGGSLMTTAAPLRQLADEIRDLAREKNAVILAHNYERPEVQDVADVVGDSLGLSRAAAETRADVIVFCGVHFMAETAAILSPEKIVLLPDLGAGCSLSDSITADQLRAWKSEHPGAMVVSYVNTTAAVKAESDYCCTSGNSVEIVNAIPADQEILFCPDQFLGAHVQRVTGRRNMHIWEGACHVHAAISPDSLSHARKEHPTAELLVHPECGCTTGLLEASSSGQLDAKGLQVLSTEGMMRRPRYSGADEFIVATEVGILHRLRKAHPDKTFYPADERASCRFMKMTTLPKVLRSLQTMEPRITVPVEIADRARLAIERMLEVGGSPIAPCPPSMAVD
jgi:quinolinate synthase